MAIGSSTHSDGENILAKAEEFLTFTLGDERYAIHLTHIIEIKSLDSIALFSIANAPPHLKGIIELHDKIVPIVDLRTVYNMPPVETNKTAVVIVLEAQADSFGIIVDGVADIISLEPEQIKDPPEYYIKQFIQGVGAIEHELYLILNVEELMRSDSLGIMHHAREKE